MRLLSRWYRMSDVFSGPRVFQFQIFAFNSWYETIKTIWEAPWDQGSSDHGHFIWQSDLLWSKWVQYFEMMWWNRWRVASFTDMTRWWAGKPKRRVAKCHESLVNHRHDSMNADCLNRNLYWNESRWTQRRVDKLTLHAAMKQCWIISSLKVNSRQCCECNNCSSWVQIICLMRMVWVSE